MIFRCPLHSSGSLCSHSFSMVVVFLQLEMSVQCRIAGGLGGRGTIAEHCHIVGEHWAVEFPVWWVVWAVFQNYY